MQPSSILALDIGERRVGVAIASEVARLPKPLITLSNDEQLIQSLVTIIQEQHITSIVVGLPRGLNGQETSQTAYTRQVAESLHNALKVPFAYQDEAGTSIKALSELQARGGSFEKSEIDSLAATYILDDYLLTQSKVIT